MMSSSSECLPHATGSLSSEFSTSTPRCLWHFRSFLTLPKLALAEHEATHGSTLPLACQVFSGSWQAYLRGRGKSTPHWEAELALCTQLPSGQQWVAHVPALPNPA